jgi:hypothetical protein
LVLGAKVLEDLAVELARARGIEPGTFRIGQKVTTQL